MVVIHGPNGYSLSLRIEGYEYPGAETGYDANWLNVRIDVEHPRGRWRFTSAWMTTVDAQGLVRWLEDAASGRVDCDWTTLEYVLSFAVATSPHWMVTGIFTREALPHWHRAEEGEELIVPLGTSLNDLRAFAEDWKSQIAKYPVRGECR